MRYLVNYFVIGVILISSFGYCGTYTFRPATNKRLLNVTRTYNLELKAGKKNTFFIPALMSFYGATNEQAVLSSDFEYSIKPDHVEITSDNLGMPRKYYRLTWNKPTKSGVKVAQHLKVRLLCRNKLCTKAVYPYSPEVLEQFKSYLAVDAEEEINPENTNLDPVCKAISTKSRSAEEIVEYVCDWINDNIEFQSGTRYGSDEAFKTHKANCTAMSKLACAMLRRMEIPCDVVSGKFIEGDSGHSFIEVYFPDAGWVFYDLSNWERGFKSLDCLMTVGYSYRKQVEGNKSRWIEGYFSQEQTVGTYVEAQPVQTMMIRSYPKTKNVLGVRVASVDAPASIPIRKRPLRELILDASIPSGVRDDTK